MSDKKCWPKLMWVGFFLVGAMLAMALFAPLIAMQDPNDMELSTRFEAPNARHFFGKDQNGSDVFSKVIHGARVSLGVAFSVVILNASLGLLLGSLAGWKGRWVEALVMRVIDMFLAFPTFLLALGIVAVMGSSVRNVIIAMCVTGWTGYARLVRGEILHLKERDYVQSALALGNHPVRILMFHIWPNLLGPLLVHATFAMAGTIIAESGLSFLGLGAPATTPTWGALLSAGRKFLVEAPHMSIFPGLAILTLVLGFNFVGDGLRDHLDPKK